MIDLETLESLLILYNPNINEDDLSLSPKKVIINDHYCLYKQARFILQLHLL